MGIRLVTEALSPEWGHLSETARLVLIAMCHTALDKAQGDHPARRYFGGHESLILTLTGRDSTDPTWSRTREHRAAQHVAVGGQNEFHAVFGADRVDCQLHLGTFSRTEIVRQTFVSRGGDHDFLLPCHGGPFW